MDFQSFEKIISKIDDIISVKIVSNEEKIEEVHILASKVRSPKQIVRDIESSLMASFGYKIDRKVISIAQIEIEEYNTVKRIRFDGISISTYGNFIECNVNLLYNDDEYSVTQKGIRTSASRRKIVAQATMRAVEKILGQAVAFEVQDVLLNKNKEVTYTIVIINMVEFQKEESLIGAAIVKDDVDEAIAKAALDSINRVVERIKF